MDENDVVEAGTVAAEEATPESNTEQTSEPSSLLEAIQEGLNPEEEKPEEEPDPAIDPEPEQANPENEDEPPEGISKKAQERFRNLTHRLKEKDSELATVKSDLEGIRAVMKDTGANAEDFGKMFDYMKCLSKGDMESVGRILADQVRQYKMMTGKSIDVDPLEQFPDLRQRVDGYQMDENTALEIARQRTIDQQRQRIDSENHSRQQSMNQAVQMKNQALSRIDMLSSEWAKRDPDYRMKEDIILKQIPIIAQRFHPSQWPQQVEILYQTLSDMPVQKPTNTPSPLRPSGQQGAVKQPGSMLEALQSGLGYSG